MPRPSMRMPSVTMRVRTISLVTPRMAPAMWRSTLATSANCGSSSAISSALSADSAAPRSALSAMVWVAAMRSAPAASTAANTSGV